MPNTARPFDSSRFQLHIERKSNAVLDGLLMEATAILRRSPGAATVSPEGTLSLRCPAPPDYQPRMHHRTVTELGMRVSRYGWVFELSEISERISSGWMANCIPPDLYLVFLQAWVSHQHSLAQGDLFA